MNVLEDLDGLTAARGIAQDGDEPELHLMQASGFLDGRYYPAESLRIEGIAAITALRDLCERLLEANAEQQPPADDPELGQRL